MDGAFYRGSATEQTTRFTDKEKKLLRDMKFEKQLETDIDLKKVNIDIIKPWITTKLTSLLGMEDDVVNEYVFSQLEQKQLNPKIMQINLTGFLNARRAREFMGELWDLFIEAQNTTDGIPVSLVQKKIEELKAVDQKPDDSVAIDLKDTSSNWINRYQSLTYGKYQPKFEEDDGDEVPRRRRSFSPRRRDASPYRKRDRSPDDRRRNRKRDKSPDDRRRDRKRDRSPDDRRDRRSPARRDRHERDRSVEKRRRSRSPRKHRSRHDRDRSSERKHRHRNRSTSVDKKKRSRRDRSSESR